MPIENINLQTNFSKNTLVLHAVANDENRMNFPLQSVLNSDGSKYSDYIFEKVFAGSHSDIGGSYANGDQGKQNDLQFLTLEWMVNTARDYGVPFKEIPNNYKASDQFNQTYQNYQQANYNYLFTKNPTDQIILNKAYQDLRQNYIHSEVSWYKPWNWGFSDREIYHPNDNYYPNKDLMHQFNNSLENAQKNLDSQLKEIEKQPINQR